MDGQTRSATLLRPHPVRPAAVRRARDRSREHLPSFVSEAPPRSEGEAFLRRIFSRPVPATAHIERGLSHL